MTFRVRSLNENLAAALHKVIGDHLMRSGLGHIWKDERTWRGFADELVLALGGKVALVDREAYGKIFADAQQMREIRKRFEAYEALRSDEKKTETGRSRNAYAQWAAENMTEKKEGT